MIRTGIVLTLLAATVLGACGDDGPAAAPTTTPELADMTIVVCDGLPSFAEDGTVTSDQHCPWSAEVVTVE